MVRQKVFLTVLGSAAIFDCLVFLYFLVKEVNTSKSDDNNSLSTKQNSLCVLSSRHNITPLAASSDERFV